jgi:catechol 2,3-dioxygenase-like lactoylglutathione lyase family enzyme
MKARAPVRAHCRDPACPGHEPSFGVHVGLLGFRKVFESGDPGFVFLKRDVAELHLTLQRNLKAADFNVAHMMVETIDHLHDFLQARGLKLVRRLQDKDYGLRAFVLEDPDGNRIDVGQPI